MKNFFWGLVVGISLASLLVLLSFDFSDIEDDMSSLMSSDQQRKSSSPKWVLHESHQWIDIAGPDKPIFVTDKMLLKPGNGFGWYAKFDTSKDALFVEETIEMSGPSKWDFKKPSKTSNEYAEVINDGQLVRTKWIFPKSREIRRGYIVSADHAIGPVKMSVRINGNYVGEFEWEIVKVLSGDKNE